MDLSPSTLSPSTSRGCFTARVLFNTSPCDEHYRLTLLADRFPATAPGQFVQLLCRPPESNRLPEREFDWDTGSPSKSPAEAFLRRPFSLAGRRDRPDGRVELDIIHRVVGTGTAWLAALCPGDPVDVLGPLGNRFTPPAHGRTALLVGGGVGIPPMLYLAAAWADTPMVAFAGALRKNLLPFQMVPSIPLSTDGSAATLSLTEFSVHHVPAVVSTDDGSVGVHGFVTDALETYLDANPLLDPVIYTCGPEAMLKRVGAIALRRGVRCQIAVERAMACGMGTCQSCCIRIKKHNPAAVPLPGSPWAWRLACTDGPVFDSRDILW